MTTSAPAEGAGREFSRVAELLRKQIKDGTYPLGAFLPPQRELASGLGVSRDTIRRVTKQLVREGLIEARQGSGSRVVNVPAGVSPGMSSGLTGQPALAPLIRRAFEAPKVSLDVFTLTSETLVNHLAVQVNRILDAKEIRPEELRIRMLLPAEDQRLAYPRAKDPEDPRIHERWRAMARRHTRKVRQLIDELREAGLDARLEVRRVGLTPSFKLYVLNGAHMLFGAYTVEETVITLDDEDETQVEALDVLGTFSRLKYYSASGDERDVEFFTDMCDWFQSNWNLLGSTPSRER